MGAALIDWTARGAVACWAARLIVALLRGRRSPKSVEVLLWLTGWSLLVVHVGCAFHFQHGWSHTAAYDHTAQRTAEATGWAWGGGVFFNYSTIAIWGADLVVLTISCKTNRSAPRLWTVFATAWVGFMILNSTLVFGPRWWWLVAGGGAVAASLAVVAHRRADQAQSDNL